MLHELSLGGVLVPPLFAMVVVTALLFWFAHGWLERHDGYRFFWHPALAGCAGFIILLALVLAVWLGWGV